MSLMGLLVGFAIVAFSFIAGESYAKDWRTIFFMGLPCIVS